METRMPPSYIFPECIKGYSIKILDNESFKTIIEVHDNYKRRRIHKFKSVTTQRICVEVYNTNGIQVQESTKYASITRFERTLK